MGHVEARHRLALSCQRSLLSPVRHVHNVVGVTHKAERQLVSRIADNRPRAEMVDGHLTQTYQSQVSNHAQCAQGVIEFGLEGSEDPEGLE
jgi:hypothetical protein